MHASCLTAHPGNGSYLALEGFKKFKAGQRLRLRRQRHADAGYELAIEAAKT